MGPYVITFKKILIRLIAFSLSLGSVVANLIILSSLVASYEGFFSPQDAADTKLYLVVAETILVTLFTTGIVLLKKFKEKGETVLPYMFGCIVLFPFCVVISMSSEFVFDAIVAIYVWAAFLRYMYFVVVPKMKY